MNKKNATGTRPTEADQNDLPLYGREAFIARLRAGETVEFRGKGNSMVPRIKSGQKCRYAPVTAPEQVHKGDMVYCHVGRYYFTHLVTAVKGSGKDTQFQISNNSGHVNGWCGLDRIYGKVTDVLD